MPLIEMTYGEETLENDTKISNTDWYVPHPNCPINYRAGDQKYKNQRIIGLEKLGVIGPNGDRVKKLSVNRLPFLNPRHNHPAAGASQKGWCYIALNVPDGVIIRLHVSEYNYRLGGHHHVGQIYLRVRESGPLLQVSYVNGHGLDYLIKGRMDRLSSDYILKHQLLPDYRLMGMIGENVIDRFVRIDELMKAEREIGSASVQTIQVDGQAVDIIKNKRVRKVNPL